MRFKINNSLSRYRKKMKTSLWKKIPKKNQQSIDNSHIHKSSAKLTANNKHPLEASIYSVEELNKLNYICFVFLKIIYLHYETNKVDFCIQSIQNNPILEYAFRLSYNEFRTKFNTLQTISNDQGENLALELSRSAKFFSILTHLFELLPPPFSAVGGVIRVGISEINKKNKVHESKNALKYCITYENFTKIVSLLFSCILVKNLTNEEDLDLSVKNNFSIFWEILKKQGEQCVNKPGFSENVEKIWAYCFCLFESTASCNSILNASDSKLESNQKNSIKNTNQLLSKFFGSKTHQGIDTILSIQEINQRPLPGLIISD